MKRINPVILSRLSLLRGSKRIQVVLPPWLVLLLLLFPGADGVVAETSAEKTVSFGVIGMAGGAARALAANEAELNIRVSHLKAEQFSREPLPDLAAFDAVITSFASGELKEQYQRAVREGLRGNPGLKVFCVGPPPICELWSDWVGKENILADPRMAAYYGLSVASMREMLRYALITYFGRTGTAEPPGSGKLVTIYHPEYGELDGIDDLLTRAKKDGWDADSCPRVALGTWRHHVLFHQPKVVDALIRELEGQGILGVCLVADDPGFQERLLEFEPDLVLMTSHTREPVDFWEKLGVPRIHALWFTSESIDRWRRSSGTGMTKSSLFHQIASSELKGATECLTAGGTESGGDSGEEILPIPDRIRRIAGRAGAWIRLSRLENARKRVAIVVYDQEADKGGLLSGPAHALNAPRSMVRFLGEMGKAGYALRDAPRDDRELLARMLDHGRQMGSWEPGPLDRMARSGQAVLVPEERYRVWFEEKVPEWRRREVIEQWGPVPGNIMVWGRGDKRFIVLPRIDLGNVTLLTQPLKGETVTASTKAQGPDESLLPPTHNYLAAYFWLQEEFKADALVHFGSHGTEWLFPGKQAVLSRSDWSDILIGDLPNINPWLASNTSELLPCKRRAMAVTIDFLPPPLMEAGLPDDLLNLESTIQQYQTLEPGALRKKFAAAITEQSSACNLDRELGLRPGPGGVLGEEDIRRISRHLHDLGNELVPASMHVLGEPPPDGLLIPYLVSCLGKRYLSASKELFANAGGEPAEGFLKEKGAEILGLVLGQGLTATEAIQACGGRVPDGGLPEAVRESLETAAAMNEGLKSARLEIDRILAALAGKFIPPGPGGNPERNPGVVPTGRNMYVMNPEELPSRASWELGARLIRDYLANELKTKGRYPRKVAFSLVPYTTYSDYGIIESQILYLMGVRPVWDSRNRVRDVELIPAAELGRPRIDVFLSARSVYRDELPSLMRLLDKAIRLAASLEEEDNWVEEHSAESRKKLEAQGFSEAKATALSRARMYGAEPEEIIDSHNWFFYLTERSGEWQDREELLDVYLEHCKHVYAEGVWGEKAPAAFDAAIQGTELILRSWYDSRDFVLSNKFAWWVDGTLSMAVKRLTGKEPGYLFVDVRDTEEAGIVDSAEVVQRDLRTRVTNPKWIAGMMREGYAGGAILAKNLDNLMGWEITRETSVSDSNWNDLVDVYVRDSERLGIREWFDSTNPHAFQKLAVTMLETVRKGFWKADDQTRQEIAAAYAGSVVKHGRAGGIREGGNERLEAFIRETLAAPKTPELDALRKQFEQRMLESQAPVGASEPGRDPVHGKRLEKKGIEAGAKALPADHGPVLLIAGLVLLIVLAGFLSSGIRKRKSGSGHDH